MDWSYSANILVTEWIQIYPHMYMYYNKCCLLTLVCIYFGWIRLKMSPWNLHIHKFCTDKWVEWSQMMCIFSILQMSVESSIQTAFTHKMPFCRTHTCMDASLNTIVLTSSVKDQLLTILLIFIISTFFQVAYELLLNGL